MKRVTPQRQSALLMAAYTLLLVIGAALPMSVSSAATARSANQGEVECGGYGRRAESTVEATDQAEAKTRPLATHCRPTPEVTSARVVDAARGHDGLDHTRFRGS